MSDKTFEGSRRNVLKFSDDGCIACCQHCGRSVGKDYATLLTRYGYIYFCNIKHRDKEFEYWQQHNGDQKVL